MLAISRYLYPTVIPTVSAFLAVSPVLAAPFAIDGDTIVIDHEHIRIANIDAPEIGHPKCDAELRLGKVAQRRMAELLGSGEIAVHPGDPKDGRLKDRYGVSWQLYTATPEDTTQRICPTLMFTGDRAGKATEAVHYYTSVFPGSSIQGILNYSEGDGEPLDYVKHAQFDIDHYTMMVMDSGQDHQFSFNDTVSLVVECDNQQQIDQYWDELTHNGGREVACGWLVDRYGISWQIIPKSLSTLLKDPERAQRIMPVLMKMKKLVIAELEQA